MVAKRGVTLKDVDSEKFVKHYAAYLKKQGKIAVWKPPTSLHYHTFCTTGPQVG